MSILKKKNAFLSLHIILYYPENAYSSRDVKYGPKDDLIFPMTTILLLHQSQ